MGSEADHHFPAQAVNLNTSGSFFWSTREDRRCMFILSICSLMTFLMLKTQNVSSVCLVSSPKCVHAPLNTHVLPLPPSCLAAKQHTTPFSLRSTFSSYTISFRKFLRCCLSPTDMTFTNHMRIKKKTLDICNVCFCTTKMFQLNNLKHSQSLFTADRKRHCACSNPL